jgi:hypothetical protein
MVTVKQSDARGRKQALVNRCIDEEDVALEIKEQLHAACGERLRRKGKGRAERGRRGRLKVGEEASADDA